MKYLFSLFLFTAFHSFSQEVPFYPHGDDDDIGISFSLRENGSSQGQSLISTFFYQTDSYNTHHSIHLASSIDNITFDESENTITFGVKGAYFLSDSDLNIAAGVDVDINSNFNDYTARILRSVDLGKGVYFDHGVSFGGFQSTNLDNGLARTNRYYDHSFSGGPELGIRASFKLGKNSAIDLSARAFYHMIPEISLGSGHDNINGARLQTKTQVAYKNDKITLFVANRSELIKAKSFFENQSTLSGGVRIPIRSK